MILISYPQPAIAAGALRRPKSQFQSTAQGNRPRSKAVVKRGPSGALRSGQLGQHCFLETTDWQVGGGDSESG